MRDYLSAWSNAPTADASVGDREREGVKRKERWWEKYTSDRWLIGERFEVREENDVSQRGRGGA